jgi:hypothetical protein
MQPSSVELMVKKVTKRDEVDSSQLLIMLYIGANAESIVYEATGPGGSAFMVTFEGVLFCYATV